MMDTSFNHMLMHSHAWFTSPSPPPPQKAVKKQTYRERSKWSRHPVLAECIPRKERN